MPQRALAYESKSSLAASFPCIISIVIRSKHLGQKVLQSGILGMVKHLFGCAGLTDDAVCQYNAYAGQNVIQNRNNLSVVALLIDAATGEIVNANKAHVANGTSGISGVGSADRKVVSVTCYDSMGRSISSAANGVNIKKVVFSDGTVKTVKVVK